MTTCEDVDAELADCGWQRSAKGNLWQRIDVGDGGQRTITVFHRNGQWQVCYAGPKGKLDYYPLFGRTEADAAAEALAYLLNLELMP